MKYSIIKIYEIQQFPVTGFNAVDKCAPLCWVSSVLVRCLIELGGAGNSGILMHQRTLKSLSSWGERCRKPSITRLGVPTAGPEAWSLDLSVKKVKDIRRASPPAPSTPAHVCSPNQPVTDLLSQGPHQCKERGKEISWDLLPVPPLPLLAGYTTAVETALTVCWVTGTLVRVGTKMEVICIYSFFISGGKPQVLGSISTGTVHVSFQF